MQEARARKPWAPCVQHGCLHTAWPPTIEICTRTTHAHVEAPERQQFVPTERLLHIAIMRVGRRNAWSAGRAINQRACVRACAAIAQHGVIVWSFGCAAPSGRARNRLVARPGTEALRVQIKSDRRVRLPHTVSCVRVHARLHVCLHEYGQPLEHACCRHRCQFQERYRIDRRAFCLYWE